MDPVTWHPPLQSCGCADNQRSRCRIPSTLKCINRKNEWERACLCLSVEAVGWACHTCAGCLLVGVKINIIKITDGQQVLHVQSPIEKTLPECSAVLWKINCPLRLEPQPLVPTPKPEIGVLPMNNKKAAWSSGALEEHATLAATHTSEGWGSGAQASGHFPVRLSPRITNRIIHGHCLFGL